MDYALNDRNLRVKKYVSDLKLDPLFWVRVLRKNDFFASCRSDPSAAVPAGACYRGHYKVKAFSCWDQFLCMAFAQLTFRREPTRHRRLSERALRSTLPLRLPQPCLSQYVSRRQRSARLAHLRGPGGALRTLCFSTDRSRHRSVQRSHRTTWRVLLAKDFPDKLRLVRFYDTVQDRRFCFLTNQLLLPALTNCQLYKMRWQVELF